MLRIEDAVEVSPIAKVKSPWAMFPALPKSIVEQIRLMGDSALTFRPFTHQPLTPS